MNRGKLFSGIVAFLIYVLLILTILFFYNIHQTKAKNYVEKNENRVTVTLVNSDKTVLNRSDKSSNKNRPTPKVTPPLPVKVPKKVRPKKVVPKKVVPKKVIPKKVIHKNPPKKVKHVTPVIPKKAIPKKVIKPKAKKVVPKKKIPKKKVPKKKIPKKKIPVKKVPKKKVPKKKIPVKKVPVKKVPKKKVPKKKIPKKSAKDLFASVKTKDIKKRPVKKRPVRTRPKQPSSSIKHHSSVADRIKSSHQSGRTSNANRDKGVENAYIAKVKRYMNNWNAASGDIGKRVTISLTIYNSGKFSYRILQGSGSMRGSLSQYLDRLKKIGLGRHSKSSPYSIKVSFTVR